MPIDGLEKSPCHGCPRAGMDKTRGACAQCNLPLEYVDGEYQARWPSIPPTRDLSNAMAVFEPLPCRTPGCDRIVSRYSQTGLCGVCQGAGMKAEGRPPTRIAPEDLAVMIVRRMAGDTWSAIARDYRTSRYLVRSAVNGERWYAPVQAEALRIIEEETA